MRRKALLRKGNRRLRLPIGKRFGKLTVIGQASVCGVKNVTFWPVRCDCGKEFTIRGASLTGKKGSRSCGCEIPKHGSSHGLWSGYGAMPGAFWSKTKGSAAQRGIPFKITKRQAWEIFETQGQRCALTGIDIGFSKCAESHVHGGTTASLDRIDSKKGYEVSNVQWVHKMVNRMKWGLSHGSFIGLCRKVTEHNFGVCISGPAIDPNQLSYVRGRE